MISLDLNLVRQKDAERAELAAQVAQFLASGGPVVEDPGAFGKPQPPILTVESPSLASEREKRKMEAQAADLALAEKVRGLADSMTSREVCAALSITRAVLRGIARRHFIQFKIADRSQSVKESYTSPEQEARDVERLRAYAQLGTSIHHAATHSGIGKTRAARLAKDYDITFAHRGKA